MNSANAVSDRAVTSDSLLSVSDLVKVFPVAHRMSLRARSWVHAVSGVSFDVHPGETLGLVGESGCGKTTTARLVLRLERPTSGKISFDGRDLDSLTRPELHEFRRNIQMVFQDPYGSLDPRMTASEIVAEPLVIHRIGTRKQHREQVLHAFETVGLGSHHLNRYPHEFSGGQRQRIGVARALVLRPKLIVCDEPVSALDVSIQSQILNLLRDLQDEFNLSYLFIAHNLSVIKHMSDRIAVMYLGKIVEMATWRDLYSCPRHPYTQALLSAVPVPNPRIQRERILLEGDVPNPINPPSGCRFHTRCRLAESRCRDSEPELRCVETDHFVACHLV